MGSPDALNRNTTIHSPAPLHPRRGPFHSPFLNRRASSVASSSSAVGLEMIDDSSSAVTVSRRRSQSVLSGPVTPLRPTILPMQYPRMIKA
jgi:hypothetical protein